MQSALDCLRYLDGEIQILNRQDTKEFHSNEQMMIIQSIILFSCDSGQVAVNSPFYLLLKQPKKCVCHRNNYVVSHLMTSLLLNKAQ